MMQNSPMALARIVFLATFFWHFLHVTAIADSVVTESADESQFPRLTDAEVLGGKTPMLPVRGANEKVFFAGSNSGDASPVKRTRTLTTRQIAVADVEAKVFSDILTETASEAVWVEFGHESYALSVLDTVHSGVGGVSHQTAVLIGEEEKGIARFTTANSGDVLVGTVRIGKDQYRILTDPSKNHNLVVHQLFQDANSIDQYPTEASMVSDRTERNGIGFLEELHLESVALANVQPQGVKRTRYPTSSKAQLVGGNLGKVNVDVEREEVPDALERALLSLGSAVGIRPGTEFEIVDITGNPSAGYIVTFRQLLAGIPVDRINQIDIAAVSGEVKSVSTFLIYGDFVDPLQLGAITQSDAESYAMSAVQNHLERFADNFDIRNEETELAYSVVAAEKLKLEWKVWIEHFLARVDAFDGSATLTDIRIY